MRDSVTRHSLEILKILLEPLARKPIERRVGDHRPYIAFNGENASGTGTRHALRDAPQRGGSS
jgi:hypothetical protein